MAQTPRRRPGKLGKNTYALLLYTPRDRGATIFLALAIVLAVIAGTAIIAQRSFDGLVGSRLQGRAKDARLTAEAATAYIISEWNKPNNRRLYIGQPMSEWTSNNASLKNRCSAPSPDFLEANAKSPDPSALAFAGGNEITLPGDGSRRFILKSARFTNLPRTSSLFTSSSSPSGDTGSPSPLGSSDNGTKRGFLELEVEGRIYKAGKLVSTSTIRREFEIEPKCCDRSFGQINPNDPTLGNDPRKCLGGSSLELGDLGIVTGITGGGLNSGSGSSSLTLSNSSGQPLDQVICIPPTNSVTCGGTFDKSSIMANNPSARGPRYLDYVTKPIEIPDPPEIAPLGLSALSIDTGLTIKPPTPAQLLADPNAGGSHPSNCKLDIISPSTTKAYHCNISNISLTGSTKTLTIDTTDFPVYLYLQSAESNITVGGNGFIRHRKADNTRDALLSETPDFQIRGIRSADSSACTTGQDFNMGGNGISAFFLWGPCAETKIAGTATWGGILWSNDLSLNGTGATSIAIPNNNGTCASFPDAAPCKVLEDTGNSTTTLAPIEWAARSVNFTRFF